MLPIYSVVPQTEGSLYEIHVDLGEAGLILCRDMHREHAFWLVGVLGTRPFIPEEFPTRRRVQTIASL